MLLKNSHVFSTCDSGFNFGFRAGTHHIARGEREGRRSWFANSYRRGGKLMGVVLYERLAQSDGAQIKVIYTQIKRRDNVLKFKGRQWMLIRLNV